MVGRTLLMTSLLAFLALSGCLDDGPDGGGETEPLDGAPPSGDGGKAADSGKTPEPAIGPVATEQAFSWDGSLGTMVYACAVVACNGAGLGDWDQSHDLSGIVSGGLTMTWDTPNELAYGLATRCDGPCDFVTYDYGASPLTLSFDDLDPGRTYTLVAWHPYSGVGVAGAQAGVQTSFHVEGLLMAV